ncbi:protransforming growth factor alpha [Corythoichthys intestinalis]|uniref:protransforming growth factor alpha n=1 Tax=Corythoichthys intestinalis TaxID=161448 RepID=UPI0025A63EA0|nr:protransforming growth factor alpha [Corythoichthys intestinalis]
MTRILWDAIFLISGSLFTIGVGQSTSTTLKDNVAGTALPNTLGNRHAATSMSASSNILFGTQLSRLDTTVSIATSSSLAAYATASNSGVPETALTTIPTTTVSTATLTTTTTTPNTPPVKKFVAAAVRSHFDNCPDSHRHFCFHGTCRYLILEETPACICHPGFVGMRCEHADLLAVVATKNRQQTVATVLVLCVIGCVVIIVVCALLNCWWRRECRKRRRPHHFIPEKSVYTQKHRAPCYPSESVV